MSSQSIKFRKRTGTTRTIQVTPPGDLDSVPDVHSYIRRQKLFLPKAVAVTVEEKTGDASCSRLLLWRSRGVRFNFYFASMRRQEIFTHLGVG